MSYICRLRAPATRTQTRRRWRRAFHVLVARVSLAACDEKAEEIDDSSGGLGQLVEDLFCTWVRARQAAEADAAETAGLLVWWMEHDEYGFCHRLEEDVVKVLDGDGLEALAAEARFRFEASAPDGILKHRLARQLRPSGFG